MQIYLWEYALSPHLGNVLQGMGEFGHGARYVVHAETYPHREAEGWIQPEFPDVEILLPRSAGEIRAVIADSSPEDVHICVGLRGNPYVKQVLSALQLERRRFLLFMETVDERSRASVLKRPLYRALFLRNCALLEGVLAAGATTPAWVRARGVPSGKVFDFAYFMPEVPPSLPAKQRAKEAGVRLLYVGSLIPRKNLALVMTALPELPKDVTLDVVGDGPLRGELEAVAAARAPGRVTFHGTRSMPEIQAFMAEADCLVLPSDHDGWGAVVVEAMLTGTPAVCSNQCGASVAVRASGRGRTFEAFAPGACAAALRAQVVGGRPSTADRAALAKWAQCLTKPAGTAYLERIVAHLRQDGERPEPPWTARSLLSPCQDAVS